MRATYVPHASHGISRAIDSAGPFRNDRNISRGTGAPHFEDARRDARRDVRRQQINFTDTDTDMNASRLRGNSELIDATGGFRLQGLSFHRVRRRKISARNSKWRIQFT